MLYHFPVRVRVSLGLCVMIGIGIAVWHIQLDPYSPHDRTLGVSGNYTFTTSSVIETGTIQGVFSGYLLTGLGGETQYRIETSGGGEILGDRISYGPLMFHTLSGVSYLYYGPVQYSADTQTGLSSVLHQYFWLGERYEEKRWKFNTPRTLYTLAGLIDAGKQYTDTGRAIEHTTQTTPWSQAGRMTLTKSMSVEGIPTTFDLMIDYTLTDYKGSPSTKPKNALDGTIFREAMIGTDITLK